MSIAKPLVPSLYSVSLSLVLLLQGMSQSAEPVLPDPARTDISREQQQEMGIAAAVEICKQMPIMRVDSPETQYIRKLGRRLAATIPSDKSWPFEFYVIPHEGVNAFTLPDGKVFVYLGTIIAAENEAQLAGVIAHEMAHTYMQHSAKQEEKSHLVQNLTGLSGALLGQNESLLGALAQAGIESSAGMVMLKYSRSDEIEADKVGTIILYKAGYNPQAMVDFHKTVAGKKKTIPQFLSTHPNPGNREAAIQKLLQEWPAKTYQESGSEFDDVRRRAAGEQLLSAQTIAAGAKTGMWEAVNWRNGIVLDPLKRSSLAAIAASKGTRAVATRVRFEQVAPRSATIGSNLNFNYQSGRIIARIYRPDNWELIAPQQQGQPLIIAPRAGIIANGFGYGAAFNTMSTTANPMTISQATEIIMKILQQGRRDLTAIGDPDTITFCGISSKSIMMRSTSPVAGARGQMQMERSWLVAIPYSDGVVFYVLFAAPESEFELLRAAFEKMLYSMELRNSAQ
jgi:beta-barrel assembly-enhancing protease